MLPGLLLVEYVAQIANRIAAICEKSKWDILIRLVGQAASV